MKKIGQDWLYWVIIALVYYVGYALTFLIPFSNMGIILLYFPLCLTLISFVYGCHRGMRWWYALMVGLLYLPVVAHSYLATHSVGMEVYVGIYGLLALFIQSLASLIGTMLRKMRKKQ